jgi:prepilin-type N-terminal cleavage/methylation domain-containing protein
MDRKGEGFTLIEVLIALAILGAALVTVQFAVSAAAFRQSQRENETISLGLAQETLERSLVSPASQAETPFAPPFERFTGQVEVAPWQGLPDLREVAVTIRWSGTTGQESLRVHTLVADY